MRFALFSCFLLFYFYFFLISFTSPIHLSLTNFCGTQRDNLYPQKLFLFIPKSQNHNPVIVGLSPPTHNHHHHHHQSAAMANMIMASCKTLIPTTPPTPTPKPKTPSFPTLSLPKLKLPQKLTNSFSLLSATTTTSAATTFLLLTNPLPALAEEFEKAALFDFNLTLPIIMVEFLLLMVALDKIYFTPLGNFMDERDAAIREKLSSVKDTSGEVKQLEEQAAAIMKAARAEISAALNKMKKETEAEVEEKLKEGRQKVEAELQEALANLEKQKEDTIKALDSQIDELSQEIVKKVLPIQ